MLIHIGHYSLNQKYGQNMVVPENGDSLKNIIKKKMPDGQSTNNKIFETFSFNGIINEPKHIKKKIVFTRPILKTIKSFELIMTIITRSHAQIIFLGFNNLNNFKFLKNLDIL